MIATVATVVGSIPSPSANSFSIGPLSLNAYGLMIALGVIVGIWLFGRQLESKHWGTADDASAIGMWAAAVGIVGARLYHVATDFDRFSDNLGAIPKIWEGGLGIPGGLLLGTVAGLWVARSRGLLAGRTLTAVAPAIPLAQAIGRVGNWFNQELFGRPTDLPWGLEIDDAHMPAGFASDTTFHPTFLYEALWNLGLVALLLYIDRRFRLAPGRLFAVYVLGYGVGRYWIEGLRIDNVQLNDVAGLRWNQWVALAAIVGGAGYLFATRGKHDTEVMADESDVSGDDVAVDDLVELDVAVDTPDVDNVERDDAERDDAERDDAERDDAERDDAERDDAERDDAERDGAIDEPVSDGAADEPSAAD